MRRPSPWPWILLVCSCSPANPPGDTDVTASGTEAAEATTSTASTTIATTLGASSDESATASESTSATTGSEEIREWIGRYDAGFGSASFTPCGQPETEPAWSASGLPGYEYCTGGPLWLHLRGTVEDGRFGPELSVVEILAGPCLTGSCEGGVSPDHCGDFDALCIDYAPPCSVVAQDCPAGLKCSPIDADADHVDCLPLEPMPGGAGDACQRLPADTCDLESLCFAIDPRTGMGTCTPLCTGGGFDDCVDPAQACYDRGGVFESVCVPRCNPLASDCPPGQGCLPPLSFESPFMCSPLTASLPAGEVCTGAMCASGLVCIDDDYVANCDGYACCAAFCDLDAPSCPPGAACTPWFEGMPAPAGFESVGVCVSP